jgi:hypothetical protein
VANRKYDRTHFLRLNPVSRRTQSPHPDWKAFAGGVLELPAILFWITLTLSSVFRVNRPFQILFERFIVSKGGTLVFYTTNLVLPLAAFGLGLFAYNRRSRKTDFSTTVIGTSVFLLVLILIYSFGRAYR